MRSITKLRKTVIILMLSENYHIIFGQVKLKGCHYTFSKKTEDNACPFNSLYWQFMVNHREELERNPRIGMVYKNWDKQDTQLQDDTLIRAQWVLDNIESL